MKPSAQDNQAWVKDRISRAGWTADIEFAAAVMAELVVFLRKLLEGT